MSTSTYSNIGRSRALETRKSLPVSQDRSSRRISRFVPGEVTFHDAYTYSLRAAYLHHLLQPRAKRKQYIEVPRPVERTASIVDLVKDFSSTGSSTKSAKLPHGFMGLLEKRMQGVLMMRERLPGYNDAAVKRTFAEAYTAFTDAAFRRQMEQERRVEDLVLIFYSNAVKSLQKGRAKDDDGWKVLLDRHVALFVRLLYHALKDNGYDRDKPELMNRLETLEKKLLTDDQDLASASGPSDNYIEVLAPISNDVKDMTMVQTVARIYGLKLSQVQSDIDASRSAWTEDIALTELKSYQQCLNSGSARVLGKADFNSDEAYQSWKSNEDKELSQMMLEILHAKPELRQSTTNAANNTGLNKPLPSIRPVTEYEEQSSNHRSAGRASTTSSTQAPSADIDRLSLGDQISKRIYLEEASFTFIPQAPRAYYREVLLQTLAFEQLHNMGSATSEVAQPFGNASSELLAELAARWRVPLCSRVVLFLDANVKRFMDREIGLDELDSAFEYVKITPTSKSGTLSLAGGLLTTDRGFWTSEDLKLYGGMLFRLHDALLRDLYDGLQHCYDSKPPSVGPILIVLENHVYNDESFSHSEEQKAAFTAQLDIGLREKAAAVYRGYLEAEIPQNQEEWQFYHVVQLGKAVVKLCNRIQKRYRNNPEIMGVDPLTILVETMFPSFEGDAADLIKRIMEVARSKNSEVDLQDGFDLYKELVEIRRIHHQVLPNLEFGFHIESALEEFVWRWINVADMKMIDLVNQAIAHDDFRVRTDAAQDTDKHSISVIDLFALYNATTDQIFSLSWDDDIHHAKFMTALSKSFGIGLSRYCEVVEQRFTTEMNRLSPAHEIAQAQSKPDRWMQVAKDAWNNKEKIEPFQFYPESLVKLNNIEFAVQQLDRLEKKMNVDACADVLNKIKSPSQQRKPQKYVFTIKIVEAQNLKACDSNGLSDPYVVLVDEFGKRLTKTRVIHKDLNPRWDESVDLSVSGAINIVAMIWDSDTFGDDDYVGRTSLKLDPSHFSDYLPKECILDLDTQGQLLLRISMEGERDDIQFYFGKAFRTLKRTERDMIRKITDKLSTVINLSLSHEALRSLFNRGISISSVTSMWRNRQSTAQPVTRADVEAALQPLFQYFNDNFAIMQETLTAGSMIMVMTRLWKEVLMAVEKILVPTLSDKPSSQRPLTQAEFDVVFRWLELLYEFFHAKDEETGEANGVPADVLKSPKYQELVQLAFFYFESTENLIRTSERMASAAAQRAQQQRNRLSAPAGLGAGLAGGVGQGLRASGLRRAKSIMLSRNLGTMKQAKEQKRRQAQEEANDDMILRILRMKTDPAAHAYLRDRSRQRERLAAAAAAELIVRQSLAGGGARGQFGIGGIPRR